ncbi:MAG: hypothetical protein ACJ76I_03275 [Gaiellaceae bacterium]
MGRGHLIRLTGAYALGLVLAAAVPAAAAAHRVPWRLLERGVATGGVTTQEAVLAGSRNAAHRLAVRVPPSAGQTVLRLDYRLHVALGVFGEFGCRDHRVRLAGIDRVGSRLAVRLVLDPLKPGVMECQARYPTFRLVSLDRAGLGRPLPTRVTVTLARA